MSIEENNIMEFIRMFFKEKTSGTFEDVSDYMAEKGLPNRIGMYHDRLNALIRNKDVEIRNGRYCSTFRMQGFEKVMDNLEKMKNAKLNHERMHKEPFVTRCYGHPKTNYIDPEKTEDRFTASVYPYNGGLSLEILVSTFVEAFMYVFDDNIQIPSIDERVHRRFQIKLSGGYVVYHSPNYMGLQPILEEYTGYRMLDVCHRKKNLLYSLKDKIREALDIIGIGEKFDYEKLKIS